jgi:hypothetical protein
MWTSQIILDVHHIGIRDRYKLQRIQKLLRNMAGPQLLALQLGNHRERFSQLLQFN